MDSYHKEYDRCLGYWDPSCHDGEPCYPHLAWDDGVKYMPHAFMGGFIDWTNEGMNPADPYQLNAVSKLRDWFKDISVSTDFDAELKDVIVSRSGQEIFEFWLVIYPNHDESGLVPVFYFQEMEGEVKLVPINVTNLIRMANAEVHIDGKLMTLMDRLKYWLGYDVEGIPLIEEWKKSASYLELNPLLRADIERQTKEDAFKEKMRGLWNDGKAGESSGQ
jgi:hypothetical protein